MKTMKAVESVARAAIVVGALALAMTGCAAADPGDEAVGASSDEISVQSSFTSKGTGYYPSSSSMQGGYVDRLGKPLKTLQSFLNGSAAYVSVAMDSTALKYGTRLRIK